MFKLLVCLILLFPIGFCKAQSVWDKLNKDPYKNSQLYIGIKAGANLNDVNVINRFSVIKPTNNLNQGLYDKRYLRTHHIGSVYGLTFLYQFEQRLVIGTNLQVNRLRFAYEQEQAGATRSVNFLHQHDINYLDIPVYFRFMFRPVNSRFWNKSNQKPFVPAVVPFAQIGLNFSAFISGNKEIQKFTTQNGLETMDFLINEDIQSTMSPFTVGAFAGAGARFRVGTFYITAEANFRQGFNNVVNAEARYANENLQNNAYDIFDDFNFRSIEALISIIVPIKYLNKKEFLPVEI